MHEPRVIVLGLGIVGSSIAAELAQRGFHVTGIEQFDPLHERGSSHGDTRIFRRVPHEGPAYVQMAAASYDGWRSWNRLAGEPLFVSCGGIDAGPAASAMVAAAERLCLDYEQPCTLMSGATLNRQYSHYNLPANWRVVFQPASGFVRPDATRSFLHARAVAAGARLLHRTAVSEIETTPAGACVRTQSRTLNQTLDCDFLVVAAGGWLPRLLPQLHFPVSVERRVLAWFTPDAPQPLADGRMPIFCIDADGGWYGMPTLEGQVKLGHDKHLRQRIDPDDATILPDAVDAAFLARCPARYLAGFDAKPAAMKACIYTLSADHHFLMDWAADRVLAFSCCSGHGFKYAPAYGAIAADLIDGRERPEFDLFRARRKAVAANRFA